MAISERIPESIPEKIPEAIQSYFNDLNMPFEVVNHQQTVSCYSCIAKQLDISGEQLLRCVILQSSQGRFMAILPSNYLLDYDALRQMKGEELSIISGEAAKGLFKQCDYGCYPPLPQVFKFDTLVDPSVLRLESAYFESGHSGYFLKINQQGIQTLFGSCEQETFACGPERLFSGSNLNKNESDGVEEFTPMRMKQRVDETFDLPSMPDIAHDIMKLRVDPGANAEDLANIVARDPSLSAQIISWACSPYYGYKGTVDSLTTAISRVLGFDLVMNLSLGITIGKSLKVSHDGPLGVRNYWRQSVYCAALVDKLCRLIPVKQRPERGLVYLSGLLHNFGHLLLGHLFPPQFYLINRYVEANGSIAIEDVEHFVLGVTHEELGAWLMQSWHMPDELITAVRWHHKEEFWSKHAIYSNLVLLANRLLKRIELGDSHEIELPQSTLELLSLDENEVNETFEELLDEREFLDIMSKQLVA